MNERAGARLCVVGGPTVVLELGGLRLLTDPTFDEPGVYPIGTRMLTKLTGPAISQARIGQVDAVLLSHDQHPDNLDTSGASYLAGVPVVFTTTVAAERLGGTARGLAPWQSAELPLPGGGVLQITATPAQHGPDGTEYLTGPVIGFLLTGAGLPAIYVSGDNASVEVVRDIAGRAGGIDIAILHAGAARTALLGDANLTLSSADAARAGKILAAKEIVPVHYEGWAHFTENADDLTRAFAASGATGSLVLPPLGEYVDLSCRNGRA